MVNLEIITYASMKGLALKKSVGCPCRCVQPNEKAQTSLVGQIQGPYAVISCGLFCSRPCFDYLFIFTVLLEFLCNLANLSMQQEVKYMQTEALAERLLLLECITPPLQLRGFDVNVMNSPKWNRKITTRLK